MPKKKGWRKSESKRTDWRSRKTGFIIKLPVFDNIENEEDLFDDMCFWNVPEEGYPAVEGSHAGEQLTDISKNGSHKMDDNSA